MKWGLCNSVIEFANAYVKKIVLKISILINNRANTSDIHTYMFIFTLVPNSYD